MKIILTLMFIFCWLGCKANLNVSAKTDQESAEPENPEAVDGEGPDQAAGTSGETIGNGNGQDQQPAKSPEVENRPKPKEDQGSGDSGTVLPPPPLPPPPLPTPGPPEVPSKIAPEYSIARTWLESSDLTIDVTCKDATHIAVLSEPTATPQWTACVSDAPMTFVLADGENTVSILAQFSDASSEVIAANARYFKGQSYLVNDPNPQANGGFGSVQLLKNGNFVVLKKYDNTHGSSAGAIHLYSATAPAAPLASVYGQVSQDLLGEVPVVPQSSGDFFVICPKCTVDGRSQAGKVMRVNGTTGAVVWEVSGPTANDRLGSDGITELSNGHLVIASSHMTVGGVADLGALWLIGSNGTLIKEFRGGGDNFFPSNLGTVPIFPLANGNFFYADPQLLDLDNSLFFHGAYHLVNGQTGDVIYSRFGQDSGTYLGSGGFALVDDERLMVGSSKDESTGNAYGSILLIRISDGALLGSYTGSINGGDLGDIKFYTSATLLSNGNIVVYNGKREGETILINGNTYSEIARIPGSGYLIAGWPAEIRDQGNGNFILQRPVYGYVNNNPSGRGRIDFINGSNGSIIRTHLGPNADDGFSDGGMYELANGNFVVFSHSQSISGFTNNGSVMLLDSTGVLISRYDGLGSSLFGVSIAGTCILPNGNYAVSFGYAETEQNLVLFNGSDGSAIKTIQTSGAPFGFDALKCTADNKIIAANSYTTVGPVANAGSLFLYDGATGDLEYRYDGPHAGFRVGWAGIHDIDGNIFAVINRESTGSSGQANAGSVVLFNKETMTVQSRHEGGSPNSKLSEQNLIYNQGQRYIIAPEPEYSSSTHAKAGLIRLIPTK